MTTYRRVSAFAFLACLLGSSSVFSQDPYAGRRAAAIQFAEFGRIEEAVAELLKILALSPEDGDAASRVQTLVQHQMPRWLPEEVEKAAPFRCELLTWTWKAAGTTAAASPNQEISQPPNTPQPEFRFLITKVGFAAREGERFDELHEEGFPFVDYAYLWQPAKRRYDARIAVHWQDPGQTELAQHSLRATALFYILVSARLHFDPTKPWGDPVDVWVTQKGEPGARAQGHSIYLYASQAPRAPEEWLRELAHEYGHVALPGVGGFTNTDDEWADGHLAELLLPKWLEETGAPEWTPWNAMSWEAQAAAARARVMARWTPARVEQLTAVKHRVGPPGTVVAPPPPLPPVLLGTDEAAREYYLGLALWVEQLKGPDALGEALRKCAQGTASRFVSAIGMTRPPPASGR